MIRLISSTGHYFDIAEKVVNLFPKIAELIDENREAFLNEVSPDVLPFVIQWALKHLDDPIGQISKLTVPQFSRWDGMFVEQLYPKELLELINVSTLFNNFFCLFISENFVVTFMNTNFNFKLQLI